MKNKFPIFKRKRKIKKNVDIFLIPYNEIDYEERVYELCGIEFKTISFNKEYWL